MQLGPKDPDCPEEGCYGFVFTTPDDFVVPSQPVIPPDPVKFTTDSYFGPGNVTLGPVDATKFGLAVRLPRAHDTEAFTMKQINFDINVEAM